MNGISDNSQVSCYDCPSDTSDDLRLILSVSDPHIASLESVHELQQQKELREDGEVVIDLKSMDPTASGNWTVPFNITGEFLGFTLVKAKVVSAAASTDENQPEKSMKVRLLTQFQSV